MVKNKVCIGIESTAHTFGVGIIKNKKIISNEKKLFSTEKGGIIPSMAAEHHYKVYKNVLNNALKKANIKLQDVDVVAFSQSPGIGHTLRIGAIIARSIAANFSKPIVGVNHCIAHLEIGRLLSKAKDPVLLYVSGANTQVISYEAGKYRIFGETLDIGVGNFLDAFARELGLGFPGGPKIYELSLKAKKHNLIELPYVVKGMDVSFGGMLTNLKHKVEKKYNIADLCYSAQEHAFAMLLEVAERAMAHTNKNELLLGGGVACNIRLQEMAKQMCRDRKAKCYILPNEFNVDNGAMIAWLGLLMFNSGNKVSVEKADIMPYVRTDDVVVKWR